MPAVPSLSSTAFKASRTSSDVSSHHRTSTTVPRSTRTPPNRSATVFAQYSANTLTLGTPANPLPVRTTSRFFPVVSTYRSSPHAFSNGTCVVVDLKCVAPSLSCVLANEYNHAPDGSITTARSARSLLSLDKTLKHARPLPTIASSHRSRAAAIPKTPVRPSRRAAKPPPSRSIAVARARPRVRSTSARAARCDAMSRAISVARAGRAPSRANRASRSAASRRFFRAFRRRVRAFFYRKSQRRDGCATRPTRRRTARRRDDAREPARARKKTRRRVARGWTARARGWTPRRVESVDLECAFSRQRVRPTRARRGRRLTR